MPRAHGISRSKGPDWVNIIHVPGGTGLKPVVPACWIDDTHIQSWPLMLWGPVPFRIAPLRGQLSFVGGDLPVAGSPLQNTPVQLPLCFKSLVISAMVLVDCVDAEVEVDEESVRLQERTGDARARNARIRPGTRASVCTASSRANMRIMTTRMLLALV